MDSKIPSPFASALRSLLEESCRFEDRASWCDFLGVSSPAISQWLSDNTIPRADLLRAIVDEIARVSGNNSVNPTPLADFRALCDRPAREITPNFDRIGPTVGHYLLGPLRANFLNTLTSLPSQHQEIVLREALDLVRRASELGVEFPQLSELRNLLERYPPGKKLVEHDLIDFYGGRRWKNISVIGAEPLELATQPIKRMRRAVPARLVSALVRNQLRSDQSEPNRSLVYVIPQDDTGELVQHVQALFWNPRDRESGPVDLRPFLLQLDESIIESILERGRYRGETPDLIVLLNIGQGESFESVAYSWFIKGADEFGFVLPPAQVKGLSVEIEKQQRSNQILEVENPSEMVA